MARKMLTSSTHFPLGCQRRWGEAQLPPSLQPSGCPVWAGHFGRVMAFLGGSPESGPCPPSLEGLRGCCLGPALPKGGALGALESGAARPTGSKTSHTLWSPTTEASLADPTKLSFMIEMKLQQPLDSEGGAEEGRLVLSCESSAICSYFLTAVNLLHPIRVSHLQACLLLLVKFL